MRPCGPSIRPCDAQQLFARRLLVGDPAEKPDEFAGAESVLGGPRAPILAQSGQVDVLFSFAGLERSDLGGVEAAPVRRARAPRRPALRRVENSRITARGTCLISAMPLRGSSHSTPRAAGQLGAKLGLVEVAGGEPVALEDRLAVEGAPLAVAGALRHVRDDHVRVEVRILGAAGAVLVGGGDEPGRVLAVHALGAATGHARLVLEVAERRLPRGQMGLVDGAARLLVAERVEQADALRR